MWWKADFHLGEPSELPLAKKALEKIVSLFARKRDETARQWTAQAKDKLKYCESRKHSLESHRYLKGRGGRPPSCAAARAA